MKITLYLAFKREGFVILQQSWQLPSATCPFWSEIIPACSYGYGTLIPHGILNYPHTGDIHTLLPYPESCFTLKIKSEQTDTSELVIWAEVIEILESLAGCFAIEDIENVFKRLLENGWRKASDLEIETWRRLKHLPPRVKLP